MFIICAHFLDLYPCQMVLILSNDMRRFHALILDTIKSMAGKTLPSQRRWLYNLKPNKMKLRLLEIELNTNDPEASKHFYSEQLGLETYVDIEGLKVFGTGINDLDLNKSRHFPGKISISFISENIQQCIDELNAKGARIHERHGNPVSAIVLQDPDGCRIEIKKQRG